MIDVRIPADDSPRPWVVAAVAAIGLAAGLGLARWGMEDERGGFEEGAELTAGESDAEAPFEADSDSDSDSEPEAEAEPASDAESDSASGAESESDVASGSVSRVGTDAESATGARSVGAAAPGSLSVRPGRVAYLRCDGLGRSGRCPRDPALEARVWEIVGGLGRCASGPRSAGQGDVRIDYRAGAAPEIRWRDTFADDVVRLDADATLGCLRTALAGTRPSLGATRLLVSFRFSYE